MGAGVRSAERDVDGAVSGEVVELLDGEFVFADGFGEEGVGVLVDLDLFGSLPHFLFDFLELSGTAVTSW